MEIARSCLPDVGLHLCDRSWHGADHLTCIDPLLDAVPGSNDRMLDCRLASAVITADGRLTHDERHVYDHALACWRINHSDVTQAILAGRAR